MTECPTCALGLTVPGEPGHVCFTRAEQVARVEKNRTLSMPVTWEGDQA